MKKYNSKFMKMCKEVLEKGLDLKDIKLRYPNVDTKEINFIIDYFARNIGYIELEDKSSYRLTENGKQSISGDFDNGFNINLSYENIIKLIVFLFMIIGIKDKQGDNKHIYDILNGFMGFTENPHYLFISSGHVIGKIKYNEHDESINIKAEILQMFLSLYNDKKLKINDINEIPALFANIISDPDMANYCNNIKNITHLK